MHYFIYGGAKDILEDGEIWRPSVANSLNINQLLYSLIQ